VLVVWLLLSLLSGGSSNQPLSGESKAGNVRQQEHLMAASDDWQRKQQATRASMIWNGVR
jgi:hypothetical protein